MSEDKFLEVELFGQRLCPFVDLIAIDKLPSIDSPFFRDDGTGLKRVKDLTKAI